MTRIYRCYWETTETINAMRRIRAQLSRLEDRLSADGATSELAERAAELQAKVREIESGIFIPDLPEGWKGRANYGTDTLRRLSALPSVVGLGEFPPTEQSYAVFAKLSGEIQAQVDKFDVLRRGDIAAFNQALAQSGMDFVG